MPWCSGCRTRSPKAAWTTPNSTSAPGLPWVTILVPPSVRVEMTGFGVTQGLADEEDLGYRLPTDAPVIQVRGIAYKGTVEIATRPPERQALRS